MFICISNGAKDRKEENYDELIDLKIIEKSSHILNNWFISRCGLLRQHNFLAKNKKDLQQNYRRNINQIVSNDSKTNFTWETPTGEVIEFVGIGGHLEKEI